MAGMERHNLVEDCRHTRLACDQAAPSVGMALARKIFRIFTMLSTSDSGNTELAPLNTDVTNV